MDKDNDLLLSEEQLKLEEKRKQEALSGTIKYLKDNGALDSDIQSAREIAESLEMNEIDSFDETLIYKGYYAAKKCKTASYATIAKALGISTNLLKFYCKQYPKLAIALQAGYMDAVEIMKESLVSKLYESAMGTKVTNTSTVETYVVNNDGDKIATSITETTQESQIAPNVSAQLELLKRLDPAWVPKIGIDIKQEVNHNFNVTEDVNVQVDYRKLSVEALKELLQSGKTPGTPAPKEGITSIEAGGNPKTNGQKLIEKYHEKEGKPRRGRPPKNKNSEEIKNGNSTSNRGRKKKDSGQH